jgi:hypothetical protein
MRFEGNVDRKLIFGINELPDNATHDRVGVIAVGPAVLADQAAILQLRQRVIEARR